MEMKHQNLRECQSKIHKDLQEIWRIKIQSQKEDAERKAQEEQRIKDNAAAARAKERLAQKHPNLFGQDLDKQNED